MIDEKAKDWLRQLLNIVRPHLDIEEYVYIIYVLHAKQKKGEISLEELRDPISIDDAFAPVAKQLEDLTDRIAYELPQQKKLELSHYINKNEFPSETSLSDLLEHIIYEIISTGKFSHNLNPRVLTELMIDLAEVKDNDLVYNPFAGAASFGKYLPAASRFYGEEINANTFLLGWFRLYLDGKGKQVNYFNQNSFSPQKNRLERPNITLSSPPFGLKIPVSKSSRFGQITLAETKAIDDALQRHEGQGLLVFHVVEGALWRKGEFKSMRAYLIEKNLLQAVVILPPSILESTKVNSVLLKISFNRHEGDKIKIFDFTETSTKKLDTSRLSELATAAFDLYEVTANTLRKFDYRINRGLLKRDRYEGSPISKILESIKLDPIESEDFGRVLALSDLKVGKEVLSITAKDIKLGNPTTKRHKILQEDALLISLRFGNPKATLFRYQGEPIYVPNNITAFKLKEEADVLDEFLVVSLRNAKVIEQARDLSLGTISQHISTKDFLSIRIDIPAVDIQKEFIAKKLLSKEQRLQMELTQLKSTLFFYEQDLQKNKISIKSIRHGIASHIGNIQYSLKQLSRFVNDWEAKSGNRLLNQKVDEDDTVADILNGILRSAENIRYQLDTTNATYDLSRYPKIKTPIKDMLDEFRIDHRAGNQHITIDYNDSIFTYDDEIERIVVDGNKKLLKEMLNYLLDNAQKHAFGKLPKEKRVFQIYLSEDYLDEKDYVLLFIRNTGKPIPEEITEEKLFSNGEKGNHSNGDGFGGYRIKQIVEYLDGEINFRTNLQQDEFVTEFIVRIPKADDYGDEI